MATLLFIVLGSVALLLANFGLYGVILLMVSQRRREIGIRMALGAQRRDVLGLVLRQGLLQLAFGLVLGIALSAGLSRLLTSYLFETRPLDPLAFLTVTLIVTATGVAACLIPGRQATLLDPAAATRCE